jgi:exodeoxyribonuclease VII large subunit
VDFIHSGVEGAGSAPEILRGIEHFSTSKQPPQVLVVIRGGGSLESLQGFNNEAGVRALYATPMPGLVGIGHDVDAPIATMVADWSASTPTAVAHVINNSWAPLTEQLPSIVHQITRKFMYRLRDVEHSTELALQNMRLPLVRIVNRFHSYEKILHHAQKQIRVMFVQQEQKIEQYSNRFVTDFLESVQALVRTVQDYERLLSASDPNKVLARGYGLVYSSKGALVRSVKDVTIGETVTMKLSDGLVRSEVVAKEN